MAPCPRCKLHCRSWLVEEEPVRRKRERENAQQRELAVSSGGWAGHIHSRVPPRVSQKIQEFVQMRSTVLHSDELINKKDANQVEHLLNELLFHDAPVQVIFLQGAVPLQTPRLFTKFCELLRRLPIWSINLGELNFSSEQCEMLEEVLHESLITHMFYECTVAGPWKESFRSTIRRNRTKHSLWRLSASCEQNVVVCSAIKNWFCPTSHGCNKRWVQRNREGWHGVERVQCEACQRWRRLPAGTDSWPREFYCQYNHWDPRFSACSAPEEEWERSLPLNGDRVLCLVGATRWCEGVVRRVPSETQWVRHKQTEDEAWVVPLYNAVNNGEIRRSADCRELASAPRARRVRKAPVQYKAESCTALSRALRVTETEEASARKSYRVVELKSRGAGNTGGVNRSDGVGDATSEPASVCIQLTLETRGETWLFVHEWEHLKPEGHSLQGEQGTEEAEGGGGASSGSGGGEEAVCDPKDKRDAAGAATKAVEGEAEEVAKGATAGAEAVGEQKGKKRGKKASADEDETKTTTRPRKRGGARDVATPVFTPPSPGDVGYFKIDGLYWCPVQVVRLAGERSQKEWPSIREWLKRAQAAELAAEAEQSGGGGGGGEGGAPGGGSVGGGAATEGSGAVVVAGAAAGAEAFAFARPRRAAPVQRYDSSESSAELSRRKREEARQDDELRRKYWWVKCLDSAVATPHGIAGRTVLLELSAETRGELWLEAGNKPPAE